MTARLRALVVAIALPALVNATPAAAADADTFVLQGSGTISPGLGLVPEQQSVSFDGTMTAVGTHGVLATYYCSFSGTDFAGSIWVSVGTLPGSCGPWQCTQITFFRVGAVMTMTCFSDVVRPWGHWNCLFTPTDLLPTTRYDVLCQGALASVP